jgi:molecular chaperone HtpG
LETIHYSAEGTNEFRALLYIPEKAPWIWFMREMHQLHLYIKRVFIMNDEKKIYCQITYGFQRCCGFYGFAANVSREILQQDAQLEKIKRIWSKNISYVENDEGKRN